MKNMNCQNKKTENLRIAMFGVEMIIGTKIWE